LKGNRLLFQWQICNEYRSVTILVANSDVLFLVANFGR